MFWGILCYCSSGTTQGKPKFVPFNDELMETTMQIYRTSFAFRNKYFFKILLIFLFSMLLQKCFSCLLEMDRALMNYINFGLVTHGLLAVKSLACFLFCVIEIIPWINENTS